MIKRVAWTSAIAIAVASVTAFATCADALSIPSIGLCRVTRDVVPIAPPEDEHSIPGDAALVWITVLAVHEADPKACAQNGECGTLIEARIDGLIKGHGQGLKTGERILIQVRLLCDDLSIADDSQAVVLRPAANPLMDGTSATAQQGYYGKALDDKVYRAMRTFTIETRYQTAYNL